MAERSIHYSHWCCFSSQGIYKVTFTVGGTVELIGIRKERAGIFKRGIKDASRVDGSGRGMV